MGACIWWGGHSCLPLRLRVGTFLSPEQTQGPPPRGNISTKFPEFLPFPAPHVRPIPSRANGRAGERKGGPVPVTFSSKNAAAQLYPVLKIAGDADHRPPVALDKPVCVIGRRWGVNLSLTAQTVSNLHALIVRERNRVYIRDLASRNRVFVNGQPVRETDLAPGDVVGVGPYQLHCDAGFDERANPSARRAQAPPAALELALAGGARLTLDHRAVLIGRRPDCDLALPRD